MATKEEILQQIEDNLPDNVTYEIEPVHVREVITNMIGSMAPEGSAGDPYDLWVKTIYLSSADEYIQDSVLTLSPMDLILERLRERSPEGKVATGHVLTVEIFNDMGENDLTASLKRDGAFLFYEFVGEADWDVKIPNDLPSCLVYTFIVMTYELTGRLLVNAATYKVRNS